jgi:hypothetical protein
MVTFLKDDEPYVDLEIRYVTVGAFSTVQLPS